MALYVNASARSLGLEEAGLSPALRGYTGTCWSTPTGACRTALRGLAKQQASAGARRVCHFKRTSALSERVPGTEIKL